MTPLAIQLGREHGDDCQYVFRQFFFVGDVVSLIDDFDIYVVFLTDRLNQLIAETDEPVFLVDDYLAAVAFANKSQKLLQAFFLIIHSGANVLDDPKLIALLFAVVGNDLSLSLKVGLLA